MTYAHPSPSRSAAPALLLSLVLTIACGSSPPPPPAEITQEDACIRCKKPILQTRFAAEFATKDGFIRKFDDIGCMIDHANRVGIGTVRAYYARDYDKDLWMEAESANYVHTDRFKTPNDGGVIAFTDRARADSLASEYQAKVLDFAALLEMDFSGLQK